MSVTSQHLVERCDHVSRPMTRELRRELSARQVGLNVKEFDYRRNAWTVSECAAHLTCGPKTCERAASVPCETERRGHCRHLSPVRFLGSVPRSGPPAMQTVLEPFGNRYALSWTPP